MIVFNEEEGLESEVCVDEMRLEHVSEFKYMGCVLNESDTDEEGGEWEGELQLLLGLWLMLEVCSFSVLGSCMKHCLCPFLYMVVRQ